MTIQVGDRLPAVEFLQMVGDGFETVALADRLAGRKVVIFAVPGAYSNTCDAAHVPSFIRSMDGLKAAGVDEVICIAANDPWVMKAWGDSTGAAAAGITMLSDAPCAYGKAVGLDFSAPVVGFIDRIVRHALYAEDGVVRVLKLEEGRGVCDLTAGETLLAEIEAL
jgi:peroxiredoxin